MRFSESIERKILQPSMGTILTKLKLKSRRLTLFFEEPLAEYLVLEEKNKKSNLETIARNWSAYLYTLSPKLFRRLPVEIIINLILRQMWLSAGLIEKLICEIRDNLIEIKTENEVITRIVGKNKFMLFFINGFLDLISGKYLEVIDYKQRKNVCQYSFQIKNVKKEKIHTKKTSTYNNLNRIKIEKGFTLKDALRDKLFILKDNRLYFRNKSIVPLENTLFHLIGGEGSSLNAMPKISFNFFREIVEKDALPEKKLSLLKTLLQVMGWGIVTISTEGKKVVVEIKNPPYGLQLEKDNWEFLYRVIQGFLWLIDKKFKIKSRKEAFKKLTITYQA